MTSAILSASTPAAVVLETATTPCTALQCGHAHHSTSCQAQVSRLITERVPVTKPVTRSIPRYRTETQMVAVTKYREEQKTVTVSERYQDTEDYWEFIRVPVQKSRTVCRTKLVQDSKWVEGPPGKAMGHYVPVMVYKSVPERENYTDYEQQHVKKSTTVWKTRPVQQTTTERMPYTAQEEQDVRIPDGYDTVETTETVYESRTRYVSDQACNCSQCRCEKCYAAEVQSQARYEKHERQRMRAKLIAYEAEKIAGGAACCAVGLGIVGPALWAIGAHHDPSEHDIAHTVMITGIALTAIGATAALVGLCSVCCYVVSKCKYDTY